MESSAAGHVLDKAGWHALNSHHAQFAIGTDRAKRYPPSMTPLAVLADYSDAALRDLASIVMPGETVFLAGRDLPAALPGWEIPQRGFVMQMVSEWPVAEPENVVPIHPLTATDVPDILKLVELTHPGLFESRTIELGHYIGIRKEGQLIAMAGERIRSPGYSEISAVCTHPDEQGKGYARMLVSRLVNENWQHGNVPYLHVFEQNSRAIRLYERLGFYKRCEIEVMAVIRAAETV